MCAKFILNFTFLHSIGVGEATDVLTVRTKGSKPIQPNISNLIEPSTNFARIHLSSWRDGGCPITHYTIEYK